MRPPEAEASNTHSDVETLPVSAIVPTIGRPIQVEQCLRAITGCVPRAAEIVIVDQSEDPAVATAIEAFAHLGARRVACDGIGQARALNFGLRAAVHDVVVITDDDCIPDPDWVGVGAGLVAENPDALVSGMVLPGEGLGAAGGEVPSIIDDEEPRDYVDELECGVLYTGNMACRRGVITAFGEFDERLYISALDNDLCYRWLKEGRRLCYRPEYIVRHLDWRTVNQMHALYVNYAVGQWMVYFKHMLARDRAILRFVEEDVREAYRSLKRRIRRGPLPLSDWGQFVLLGFPRGARLGWQAYAPRRLRRRTHNPPPSR